MLETFINEAWVKDLDFEQSEKVDKSFISEHYKETESDILYQVPFQKKEAYVYILIEFQSTVNWFMALRVLHYMSSFWLDYAENHPKCPKLPPIFPIVLYSGEEPWMAATQLAHLWEQPNLFTAYQPQFRYFKIIENEYSQTQLLQIGNLVSTLFLAEIQPDIELPKNELLNSFDREEDKQAISLLLNWFKQLVVHGRRSTIDYHELKSVITSKQEAKAMLETAIEQEQQKRFEQGKVKGKTEGGGQKQSVTHQMVVYYLTQLKSFSYSTYPKKAIFIFL